MTSPNEDIKKNGWEACPLNPAKILKGKAFLHEPQPLKVDDISFPSDDPAVAKAQEYAKARLTEQTYNHSMRVYYYCKGHPSHSRILPQFPPETLPT